MLSRGLAHSHPSPCAADREKEMPKNAPKYDGMPETVKEVYVLLVKDLFNVNLNWTLLCQLFASGQDRIDLLNRFGQLFFHQVRQLFLANVFLRLCHLTDPSSMGRYENCSIPRLLETIKAHDEKLLDTLDLKKKYAELSAECDVFREWRNRELAHRDWSRRDDPLPASSKLEIDNALEIIKDIMITVDQHFTGNLSSYHGFGPGDADQLVGCLQDYARRCDEERKAMGLNVAGRP
jgi:AbiU2